tara:strand:- start:91 stop:1011 length:921 start_codon:yes stop_codon:yes gene_type:complete
MNKNSLNFVKDEFLQDGVVSFGKTLQDSECDKAAKLVIDSRPWDQSIFREYDEVFGSKRHLNVAPLKGGFNLADKMDLNFIESNKIFTSTLENILGKNYECLLKKIVVSTPLSIIPDWLKKVSEKKLDGHLAQYIKPEFRDISYFSGIDYHMDLIDYPDFDGNYVTVYVYLTDVDESYSPLHIIPKSHRLGATLFPHNLKKTNNESTVQYSKNNKDYDTFEVRKLVAEKGSVFLWTALTLHGTKLSNALKPRVSVRYTFSKKSSSIGLIDELYKDLKSISLKKTTRDDIKFKKNEVVSIKNQRFLV